MSNERDEWEIGLSSWIIQDGNYADFKAGQHAEFALEFFPHSLGSSDARWKSAKRLGAARYEINGEVVYLTGEVWVLDFGICAFQESTPPRELSVGQIVAGEIYLGIDPFFYFERLYTLPGMPPLVYFISHNIARKEVLPDGHGGFKGEGWVHRKGATRAFPAGHPSLKDTPFMETGHPILLPGNPCAGSVIMVADAGAEKSAYSVNHGAGRCMGRKAADRALDQKTVDNEFVAQDILTNCRLYPKDEAPAAYKDFDAVLDSVKAAGLASEIARLKARFVIKDADTSLKGAA